MKQWAMPPTDEVIHKSAGLLVELGVRRCAGCGLYEVWNGRSPGGRRHARCGGVWVEFDNQPSRVLVLTFLSRQMFTTRRRQ